MITLIQSIVTVNKRVTVSSISVTGSDLATPLNLAKSSLNDHVPRYFSLSSPTSPFLTNTTCFKFGIFADLSSPFDEVFSSGQIRLKIS